MPNMDVGINLAPYDCINDCCGVVSLLKRLLKGIWSKSNCFNSFRTKNQCSGLKRLVEGKAWPTTRQLWSDLFPEKTALGCCGFKWVPNITAEKLFGPQINA